MSDPVSTRRLMEIREQLTEPKHMRKAELVRACKDLNRYVEQLYSYIIYQDSTIQDIEKAKERVETALKVGGKLARASGHGG